MSNPDDYTIGWICAIGTEYIAAQELLDDEHDPPKFISTNDSNDYTLGRLGKHNVVIAVLPDGEYGTASAASVATHMLHSFPSIRMGLMVGIGGGAPSLKHDIRLGDVIVSAPRDGESGVFEYDFGKTIQGRAFHYTRVLNQPPISLRTAMTGIQAQYKRKGHQLDATINEILQKNPRLEGEFKRPSPDTDRLFKAELTHDACCTESCITEPLNLVPRRPRTKSEDNPAIHYGLIASANQLMKDATIRDKLAMEKAVLCFEMEAAGLMNPFPCLVIRGICDYADSHKNKEWQGYAAMVAAAYAKDLLSRIPPNKVEAEKKITDIMSCLHKLGEEHIAVAKQQLQVHKDQAEERREERLSKEEQKCHQLFRLTTSSKDTTYEWYKDRVEDRVEETCLWFLHHGNFQQWLKQESGPLLVSADPGCGKSVLAKYLIDHALPQLASICYFFFKDHDQNTTRQALCAVLHQLFKQRPLLIRHAMPQYRKDGPGLINSTESLWKILREAIIDPQAGPVIVVLDALDECDELELEGLIRNVESQFQDDMDRGKLKYLLTTRPYDQVVSKFQDLSQSFQNIRIPGEEESEAISKEINRVIAYRTNRLAEKKGLPLEIKSYLEERLSSTAQRTYLWVHLVFDYLEEEVFKKTMQGVKLTIASLPRSINEAYERILNKSKEDPMVRKVLSIILAASQPLTLAEMNVAINIDKTIHSIHDIDLENENNFKSRLRSWCGLFISIYHGRIYFLHQTAREFLLADSESPVVVPLERWHHSITLNHAHGTLMELCVLYLNFFNSDAILPTDLSKEARYAFLDYSAKNWNAHFSKSRVMDDAAIVISALKICDPALKSYSAWFGIYWKSRGGQPTALTDLMVASYFGHHAIIKLLLDKGAEIESKDRMYHRTPLAWAAECGHEAVVKQLRDNGAEIDSKNDSGQTPLLWAAESGNIAIVKLLLDQGAEINMKDKYGQTPLSSAATYGHIAIVKLLLDKGAEIDMKDNNGQTPLSHALCYEAIVKLLLDYGAKIHLKDKYGRMPLADAAAYSDEATVKLLLDNGAEIDSKDNNGQTPLSRAAERGTKGAVKPSLGKGAEIDSKDNDGWKPLVSVTNEGIIKLLLDNGAEIDSKDNNGQTPLSRAATRGIEAYVKLLLDKGAKIELKDKYGKTPLSRAAGGGNEGAVKLLLDKGAKINSKDNDSNTPLSLAAAYGHKAIVKVLLDQGPTSTKDSKYGQMPLL